METLATIALYVLGAAGLVGIVFYKLAACTETQEVRITDDIPEFSLSDYPEERQ